MASGWRMGGARVAASATQVVATYPRTHVPTDERTHERSVLRTGAARPVSENEVAARAWKAHSAFPSEAGIAGARFKSYVRVFEPDLLLDVLSEYAAGGWHAHAFTQQTVRDRIGKFREIRRDAEKNSERLVSRGLRSLADILSAGLPADPAGGIDANLSKSTTRPGRLANA